MAKVIALILGVVIVVTVWFIARAEVDPVMPAVIDVSQNQLEPEVVTAVAPSTPAATRSVAAEPTGEMVLLPLRPADPAQAAGFGAAVAAGGDMIVVGAPQADDAAGALYLFEWDGQQWQETARLTASDRAANDSFGRSVAVSGQTILVGASGHDAAGGEAGAAYVFELDNGRWQQTAKLLPGSTQDIRFGWAVALDGQTAVVGAPYRTSQGEIVNVGSATVFTRQDENWRQQARLTTGQSGGLVGSDLFGWSVAVDGSTVAVGAYLDDAVYLYQFADGQWQAGPRLQIGTLGYQFGYSVALAGGQLVVGAPAANTGGPWAGTAVLFTDELGSWTETARLTPDSLRPGSRFGWSVALAGDVVAVGMRESEGRSDFEESGGTFAFRIADGKPTHLAEFYAPNPAPFDHLGTAVAVSDNIIFSSAPGQGDAPGVVYTFSLK